MANQVERLASVSKERAMKGIELFLEGIKAYEVVDTSVGKFDFVAFDEDDKALVFVQTDYTIGKFPKESEKPTEEQLVAMEYDVMNWLASQDRFVDVEIRFDFVYLCVSGDSNRGMIKHHINYING